MGGPQRLADPERDGTVFARDLTDAPEMPVVPGATLRPATAADAAAPQETMDASGVYPKDGVETRLREGRRLVWYYKGLLRYYRRHSSRPRYLVLRIGIVLGAAAHIAWYLLRQRQSGGDRPLLAAYARILACAVQD